MRLCGSIVAYGALLVLVLSSILFLVDQLSHDRMKTMMLVSSLVWFAAEFLKSLLSEKSPQLQKNKPQ